MIDGFIVREMYRRCQYNPNIVERVLKCIKKGANGTDGRSADMVQTLWNLYQESGFLSARILDYLYEDTIGLVDVNIIFNLISTFPDMPFQLVCVHDAFKSHPVYGNDIRRMYNNLLADINDSKLLSFIASQIANQEVIVKKVGLIPRDVILNANYTLS